MSERKRRGPRDSDAAGAVRSRLHYATAKDRSGGDDSLHVTTGSRMRRCAIRLHAPANTGVLR